MVDALYNLAVQIAPELRQQPLYFISTTELDGIPRPGADAFGWADCCPVMGAAYAERLGERFIGPGRVIAIDDAAIAANCDPENFDRCLAAVALHELSHILPAREVEPCPPTQRAVQAHVEALERFHASPPVALTTADDPDHDWRFVRRCCHLFCRATALGVSVPWRDVLSYPQRWSGLDYFLPFIAGEALAMQHATFAEIEATPPPAGFVETFDADLNYHRRLRGSQQ